MFGLRRRMFLQVCRGHWRVWVSDNSNLCINIFGACGPRDVSVFGCSYGSIGDLFVGAIIPGLILVVLYCLYVIIFIIEQIKLIIPTW